MQTIARNTYECVAETSFGRTKTYIHAANQRQAAAILRKMLKSTNPQIKSITIAPN